MLSPVPPSSKLNIRQSACALALAEDHNSTALLRALCATRAKLPDTRPTWLLYLVVAAARKHLEWDTDMPPRTLLAAVLGELCRARVYPRVEHLLPATQLKDRRLVLIVENDKIELEVRTDRPRRMPARGLISVVADRHIVAWLSRG